MIDVIVHLYKKLMRKLKKFYFFFIITLLVILAMVSVSYVNYSIAKTALTDEIVHELGTLADIKVKYIQDFIRQKESDFVFISKLPFITNFFLGKDLDANEKKQFENDISNILQSKNLMHLYFFKMDGQLLASFPAENHADKNSALPPELKKTVDAAIMQLKTSVSNFFFDSGNSQLIAYMATPIIKNGETVGILACQISNLEVLEILNNSTDLGTTGETIGGVINDGEFKLISTRSQRNLDLSPTSEMYIHLNEAASGKAGNGSFIDDQGHDVLASWRYLPELKWGILIKVDKLVALEPIKKLLDNTLLLTILLLTLFSLLAFWLTVRLEKTRAFLKNIIDSINSPLAIVNSNLEVIRWNAALTDNVGISEEEIFKTPFLQLYPFLNQESARIGTMVSSQTAGKIEKISDGKDSFYSILFYPLVQDKVTGGVFLIDNITERVKITESLVQNDKLAALGILTAGIAHEINNPINFIAASIDPMKKDLDEVFKVLEKYSAVKYESPDLNKEISKIVAYKKEIDLDYSIDEIKQLLNGMEEGAKRTAAIVKGLRSFSRVDEQSKKQANINEGIDATLSLLKNKYKGKAEIIKDYGNIPEIDCFPGKLNQVFMNILSNSIDAIQKDGKITIKTYRVDEDHIAVSIKDNGSGIPDDVKDRIFEPFFTTKSVGKGTGLGLSISIGIIKDHGGDIKVISEVNKGTEFIITLPIKSTIFTD